MDAYDLKALARQRREKKLIDMRDGLNLGDRTIPSGKQYKRNIKHRPQTASEWERVELW